MKSPRINLKQGTKCADKPKHKSHLKTKKKLWTHTFNFSVNIVCFFVSLICFTFFFFYFFYLVAKFGEEKLMCTSKFSLREIKSHKALNINLNFNSLWLNAISWINRTFVKIKDPKSHITSITPSSLRKSQQPLEW